MHRSPLWLGCGKGRLGFVLSVEDVLNRGTSIKRSL
jgi:hypothetical protein